jgi:hypothetical protein
MVYPRVISVTPLRGKRLRVAFSSGVSQVYDCNPLLNAEPFAPLKSYAFFARVRPAEGGYGIVWSDEVDLSESEMWLHGKVERIPQPRRRGNSGVTSRRGARPRRSDSLRLSGRVGS